MPLLLWQLDFLTHFSLKRGVYPLVSNAHLLRITVSLFNTLFVNRQPFKMLSCSSLKVVLPYTLEPYLECKRICGRDNSLNFFDYFINLPLFASEITALYSCGLNVLECTHIPLIFPSLTYVANIML